MFHYPYFENDEGTYMAQAWSLITHGKLAPYTYWYDHAPVGWIFTAIWIFLMSGLFSFGFSVNSGRIFMLILHLVSTFLLYRITKKITNSNLASFITCLFFSISPLAIYFQRRLLLDNIMTFWVLVSLYFILFSKQRLWPFLVSAMAFGIATLSKEDAVFFMPVFAGLVAFEAHKHNRIFAVVKWIAIASMIISLYPLYALIKKEFFPTGSIFSPPYRHVSLLGSLKMQASRGTGLPFWAEKSDFMTSFHYWLFRDPLFIILGFLSFFAQGVQALFKKSSYIVFLLTLSILAFLASGKLVINFYVLPLLPFLAMCIGVTIDQQVKQIRAFNKTLFFVTAIAIFLGVGFFYYKDPYLHDALFHDETSVQLQAINWIKKHIDPKKFIAIDYYGNLDLSESRFTGDPRFYNADWYWKVEYDSDIRTDKLKDNFHNIDYIMLTAQMYSDLNSFPGNTSILKKALNNSRRIATFAVDNRIGSSIAKYAQSHPNGDWVMIYKQNTDHENSAMAWEAYKKAFIDQAGRTIDPSSQLVTSEDQAYSLLHAVWANDKKTFDTVLSWTYKNMLLSDKYLFASGYGTKQDGSKGIVNDGTASDADQNIALALILADRRWHDTHYRQLAESIIPDIWLYDSAVIKGKRYIVAGDWASQKNNKTFITNTSYILPYAYKEFALVDRNDNWSEVVATAYQTLTQCTNATLDGKRSVGIPPDWCKINRDGTVTSADNITKNSSDYSGDAMRVLWNVALDFKWFHDNRDLQYLNNMRSFWTNEWNRNDLISASYSHNGKKDSNAESLAQYGSLLAYFTVVDKKIAGAIYEDKILKQYTIENGISYWGDKNNYYTQNWVWLGIALYSGNLSN